MINFSDWRAWQKNLPWPFRWFVLLILLRPVIDNFYYLKEISPFLSPLIIIGVLTPILCITTIRNYNPAEGTSGTTLFDIWSVLIVISSVIFIFYYPNQSGIKVVLKLSLPVYLFYFLRRFILNITDLQGILFTFIMAAYISIVFLVYELIFNPIQEVEYTRGIERYRGGYADVMNYGIYITFGLLCSAYFFIARIKIKFFGINNFFLFIPLTILTAIKISHVASYIVVIAIVALTAIQLVRGQTGIALFFIIILGGAIMYFGDTVYKG